MPSLFQRLFARTPMARSTRAYEFALSQITLPPEPWVLDIGTGQGYGAAFLSRALPDAHVVSMDVRVGCIRWEELKTGPRPPMVVQASAPYMPFAHQCMDLVLAVMTFHCLPEPQRVLEEAARVLRPGGTLVLADVDGHHPIARPFEWVEHLFISPLTHAYTAEELEAMLRKAGFTHITFRKRPGREKGFLMWTIARLPSPA
ncbi:MAG: methyltransferase domain-containing protein [Chloroflexi bacterium]|nr:methyltransferase domain-containing protein [Chloroflexota bacterium]